MRGISSMATRGLLAELAPGRFEMEFVGAVVAIERLRAREGFDFAVLHDAALAELAREGIVDFERRSPVARSAIEVAVRAGAPRPRLGSAEALRSVLLAAATIGLSRGPSGQHLRRLLDRWGIAEAIAPKLVIAPPGSGVGNLVARGEAEIGFQQSSELLEVDGIDIAGPLPPEVQEVTVFSAAPCVGTPHGGEVAALLAWLASPETAPAKRRHGMEP